MRRYKVSTSIPMVRRERGKACKQGILNASIVPAIIKRKAEARERILVEAWTRKHVCRQRT